MGAANPTYYVTNEYEVINNQSTKYIFAGNLRVAKVSSAGVYYFHKDHLGSSTVMTGNTGGVVETSEYRPYGSFRSLTGTTVSDYKFTDQEWDAEAGLYNYDARLYDPVIGRFISADSIFPDVYIPQNLNRYSYCLNNPMIYTDPTGHLPFSTLGTRTWGEENLLGYNDEKRVNNFFMGAKGPVMMSLSYAIPGLQKYAKWHDSFCTNIGITSPIGKALSNVAIVSLPVFIAVGIWDDIKRAFSGPVDKEKLAEEVDKFANAWGSLSRSRDKNEDSESGGNISTISGSIDISGKERTGRSGRADNSPGSGSMGI